MSKVSKKWQAKETKKEETKVQNLEVSKSELEPKQEIQETSAKTVTLQDFARLKVKGYKEHWWPSIEKFAKNHGWNSLSSTEANCASLLTSWGASLK